MSVWDGDCDESTRLDEARAPLSYNVNDGAGPSREGVSALERSTSNDSVKDENNEICSSTITIPSTMIDRIVGKRGRETRELAFESKAKICVGDSSGDFTEVKLLGTGHAVAKAERLINESIKDCNFLYLDSDGMEMIDWEGLNGVGDEYEKERINDLPTVRKDFYNKDPVIGNVILSEVKRWSAFNNNIKITRLFNNKSGQPYPKPIKTFEQAFQQYPEMLKKIYDQGYKQPTPIQRQAWPVLLSGGDMIGIAPSGTGNTLAYLLPALIHADGQARENRDGPKALIVVSTRAKAHELYEETLKYLPSGIKCLRVIGGHDMTAQIKDLINGVDVVIGTLGRLYHLMSDRHLHMITFSYIVLDEAEYLLRCHMSLISRLFFDLRPDHQTVMMSSGWPRDMLYFAEKYMSDPVRVTISSRNTVALLTVTQKFMFVHDQDKYSTLSDTVLNMKKKDKVIIFCCRAQTADYICKEFINKKMDFCRIPEGIPPYERKRAYYNMIGGTKKIIITTDSAAKKINIKDVTHVINFDFSPRIKEFFDRVRRICKGKNSGTAISFITNQDWTGVGKLIKILQEAEQDVPEDLLLLAEREFSEYENE